MKSPEPDDEHEAAQLSSLSGWCGVVAACCGRAAERPAIGVLSPFIDADSTFLRDLRQGLGDRGLREGQEIAIEHRSAEGRINQLPVLADELVRLKVDIIVTASAPAIRFVQQATLTIPDRHDAGRRRRRSRLRRKLDRRCPILLIGALRHDL
jgi:ABC-type uncharacterized transport system substrate-binding protein